jgi:hypothetical protein
MSVRTCCAVVELRQYTLVPGGREVLISLFEQHFIESQEATGMTVIGQFRDLNNPDRFVWLRGFESMDSRARQLQEFYGGPVWKEHREAANATMIDSDNVLLLRPARPGSGFSLEHLERPSRGVSDQSKGLIVAVIFHLGDASHERFVEFFENEFAPKLIKADALVLATFVTENHPNTFPALPIREGENVFVAFSRFQDRETHLQHAAKIASHVYPKGKPSGLVARAPEILLLTPTARSLLRGSE